MQKNMYTGIPMEHTFKEVLHLVSEGTSTRLTLIANQQLIHIWTVFKEIYNNNTKKQYYISVGSNMYI